MTMWVLLLVKIVGGMPVIATAEVPSLALCKAVAADMIKHEDIKAAQCLDQKAPI